MATKKTAKKKVEPKNAILCTQSFREARGDLERPRLTLAGIVRGKRSYHSTTDWKERSVRREAEENLRQEATSEGYTHVFGCRIVEVEGLDKTYGKCLETFYFMEGDGYEPIDSKK